MPRVKITQSGQSLELPGQNPLYQELLDADVAIASSCYGEGVCGKCQVIVLEGDLNLSEPTDIERATLKRLEIPPHRRLSCQCRVLGPVTVDTDYW